MQNGEERVLLKEAIVERVYTHATAHALLQTNVNISSPTPVAEIVSGIICTSKQAEGKISPRTDHEVLDGE